MVGKRPVADPTAGNGPQIAPDGLPGSSEGGGLPFGRLAFGGLEGPSGAIREP